MKKFILLYALIASTFLWTESFSEDAVISKLNQFFELLDLEVYDKEKVSSILTDDFLIFEMGKGWNMDEFDEFIQEASKSTISTDWVLSEYVISIDNNSAHISYINNGVFKTTSNETIYSHWLESVYMVLEGGELKLKFLQSDLVDRETK